MHWRPSGSVITVARARSKARQREFRSFNGESETSFFAATFQRRRFAPNSFTLRDGTVVAAVFHQLILCALESGLDVFSEHIPIVASFVREAKTAAWYGNSSGGVAPCLRFLEDL